MLLRLFLGAWAVSTSLAGAELMAQGTAEDYERSSRLYGTTVNKVFRQKVEPQWFHNNTFFWYRNDLPGNGREFIVVDVQQGKREPAFNHEQLAQKLAKLSGKEVSKNQLPINELLWNQPKEFRFKAFGKMWKYERESETLTEEKADGKSFRLEGVLSQETIQAVAPKENRPRRRGESPDGKWIVSVQENNIYLRSIIEKPGEKIQEKGGLISKDGTAEDGYSGEFYWSPDSTKFIALRLARSEPRKVHLIESSPKDQLQPRLLTLNYDKPGDKLPVQKPHLFDVKTKKEIPVSDKLFPNPWSIQSFRWSADSSEFTFLYNQRGHQVMRVVGIRGDSGEVRAVIDEQPKTFFDYAHKLYHLEIPETGERIWMSERSGWNHLYLYAKNGDVKPITQGEWVVRGVDRVDVKKREIYFRAGGIYPDQDPYHIHYCRVSFDGSNLTKLTDGDGSHKIDFSPNDQYLIDTYSRVDLPPVTELRSVVTGKKVCDLEKADWSALLKTGWKVPERFVAKGRDGKTDIYGVIYRPTHFDANKKYPIIEQIYAGPHGSHVPKTFRSFHYTQEMAELGFILVQIDGMGTSNRSKAFHDVCWKNLADAGFPDRIAWIKAAAQKYPQMDLTRIGIFGGSAGGQNALQALLGHGDFYKVAVADCGCHDNRMDKVWWNELWMSYPVGPHYAEQSNVTQAHKLQGKLFLVVGELDRNVDPSSTMQVVNALIKANKDFDLLVVPGGGHGIAESPYGARRRKDFLVRHLWGAEPRRSGS